jgi:hypothetical protein
VLRRALGRQSGASLSLRSAAVIARSPAGRLLTIASIAKP